MNNNILKELRIVTVSIEEYLRENIGEIDLYDLNDLEKAITFLGGRLIKVDGSDQETRFEPILRKGLKDNPIKFTLEVNVDSMNHLGYRSKVAKYFAAVFLILGYAVDSELYDSNLELRRIELKPGIMEKEAELFVFIFLYLLEDGERYKDNIDYHNVCVERNFSYSNISQVL